jgi:uncharacterized heparinase superfamily protein
MELSLYFHTLRHLRPEQIYGRIWFTLNQPKPEPRPAPRLRPVTGQWALPAKRRPSLVGPASCRFLNKERNIAAASAWNDPSCEKLWLYNLHYFDDLNAEGAVGRLAWHERLINRWVDENPPGRGAGWEPYPTSLRIVNWIKWALRSNVLAEQWQHNLAIQARWLLRRLEWHLLGNHLFANAKALVFAGCFFEGPEADAWLVRGLGILERELPEQILSDGGQFERSPMYHALALEDVLDLINLFRAFPCAMPNRWRELLMGRLPELAMRMQSWLAAMSHPDGEIAFFNDAAVGVAPSPAELARYATDLELGAAPALRDGVTHLEASGYIRVQRDGMLALLDVAPVGPDYLPGHAHADTLSLELSLFGQRVLVNSGTSVYGSGPERQRQRGTPAHNTVTIENFDSSEVWSGFRVARRAKPFGLAMDEAGDIIRIRCAHDGYRRLPGRPVHRREWRFNPNGLTISDEISGCFSHASARFHFHPPVSLVNKTQALLPKGHRLNWRTEGAETTVVPSNYHPELGLSLPNWCLTAMPTNKDFSTHFHWRGGDHAHSVPDGQLSSRG